MSEWDELIRLIDTRIKERVPPQLRWARVDKVDWPNRRADVTVIADELAIYDVELGLGGVDLRPKIGSQCLVLLVEGSNTRGYMLTAAQLEGVRVVSQNESLKAVLNDLIDEVKKIIVVHGTTPDVPVLEQIKQRLNKILIP